MAHVREEIIEMERRFWEHGADPEFYDETMDDEAITVIEPMGFISKDQAIQMSNQGENWVDVKMQDVHVIELTPDCVAVAYHGEAKSEKSGKPYQGSINSVYVKKDGQWRLGMTSHQPWKKEQSS